MLGNFACFLSSVLFFFKINFQIYLSFKINFQKKIQEHYQSVKQLGMMWIQTVFKDNQQMTKATMLTQMRVKINEPFHCTAPVMSSACVFVPKNAVP